MTQSPVEWNGYEASQSGSPDQTGDFAAMLSQPTQEQQLQQQIQQMQQQQMQQMQQQLPQMQQQLMQQSQMQNHRVDQMMQQIFGLNQTSLQNYQHQFPILSGPYPTNGNRPPNPQTSNPPTYHTLQPASRPPTSNQPGLPNPPTSQSPPGGLSVVVAKSASGSLSGNVTVQPKRPMNAFMIWAKSERGLMAKENPKKHNSEISKLLGLKWKAMQMEQKQPFLDEAKRMAAQLLIDYPDYKYQPTKKKKKLPAISGKHPGSGPFAPPGGSNGQSPYSGPMLDFLQGQMPMHASNDDLYAMNPGAFSGQDMANANGQANYGSLGGFVGQSYPIANHNVLFQGYPPPSFGFNGMTPGYISHPQQSITGGGQPRPQQTTIGGGQPRSSQMPRIKAESTSPEDRVVYSKHNPSNSRVMTQTPGEVVSQPPDNSGIVMPSFLFVSGPQVSAVQSTPPVWMRVKNPYSSEAAGPPLENRQ